MSIRYMPYVTVDQVLALRDSAMAVEAERDALAALLARFRGLGNLIHGAAIDTNMAEEEFWDRMERWEDAANETPEASLSRIKAQWQAEALEQVSLHGGREAIRFRIHLAIKQLRRQAGETP